MGLLALIGSLIKEPAVDTYIVDVGLSLGFNSDRVRGIYSSVLN
jgi:hypothetical protein